MAVHAKLPGRRICPQRRRWLVATMGMDASAWYGRARMRLLSSTSLMRESTNEDAHQKHHCTCRGSQRRAFAVGLVRLILDLVVLHPFQPAVQQD